MVELSIEDYKRLFLLEGEVQSLRSEQMRLVERMSLLELSSRNYEQ